jgi:glycosyl transferase family 87
MPQNNNQNKTIWKHTAGWAFLIFAVIVYFNLQVIKPLKRFHCNDFKHLYVGSLIIRNGDNPYNAERMFYTAARVGLPNTLPYVYLPFTGIVLSPLTYFDFRTAAKIWFWINQILLLASLLLIIKFCQKKIKSGYVGLWILFLAIFFPLTRNFTAGQLNVVLLFCFSLVWFFHKKKMAPAVGAVSAFAALFKLSPGILFLYFLWKRQWKNLIWACIFSLIFLLFSLAVSGFDVHKEFIPVLGQMSYGHSTWEQFGHDFYRDPFNQSFNSFFHHILAPNPHTIPWIEISKTTADNVTKLVSFILLALVLFVSRPRRSDKKENADRELRDYSLFIFLALLIPSLCWDHYFVQALFPIIILAAFFEKGNKWQLPLFCISLIVLLIPYNFGSRMFRSGPGILLMSIKLIAGLFIFILLFFMLAEKDKKEGEEKCL